MDKQEWLRRYRQAFIDMARLSEDEIDQCVEANSFEDASKNYEDDPEGAVQEEMSYWEE